MKRYALPCQSLAYTNTIQSNRRPSVLIGFFTSQINGATVRPDDRVLLVVIFLFLCKLDQSKEFFLQRLHSLIN